MRYPVIGRWADNVLFVGVIIHIGPLILITMETVFLRSCRRWPTGINRKKAPDPIQPTKHHNNRRSIFVRLPWNIWSGSLDRSEGLPGDMIELTCYVSSSSGAFPLSPPLRYFGLWFPSWFLKQCTNTWGPCKRVNCWWRHLRGMFQGKRSRSGLWV